MMPVGKEGGQGQKKAPTYPQSNLKLLFPDSE